MRLQLLGANQPAKSLNASAEQRLNLYLDILPQEDKATIVAYGMPGHEPVRQYGAAPIYGLHHTPARTVTRFVQAGRVLDMDDATLAVTDRGGLGADAPPVYAARPDETLFVSAAQNATGTVYSLKADLAATPVTTAQSVTYLASRFIADAPGPPPRIVWSDLLDGRTWPALNFAAVESCIDGLQRVFGWRGMLIIFGTSATEFWTPTADPNLPFSRIEGVTGNFGLADKHSLAASGDKLFLIASMGESGRKACLLDGFQLTPVSTPDVEALLATPEFSVMSAYAYQFDGHTFYTIRHASVPGVAANELVYDATSGVWSQGTSGLTSAFNAHSAVTGHAVAGGTVSGDLVRLRPDRYTKRLNGVDLPLEAALVLPHAYDKQNLNEIILARFRLDMEPVVGSLSLALSRDGGKTYGPALTRTLDATNTRAEWRRLGKARSFTLKLTAPGGYKVAFLGATADLEATGR